MKIIRKAVTGTRSLRTLPREKRGNAALIIAASLPAVVGAMGLGVDFTQWVVHKRSLQGAADAAALAGARTRHNGVDLAGVTVEATKVVNSNSSVTRSLTQVNFLASPGQASNTPNPSSVEVILQASGRLYFAGLFLSSQPTIRVRAVAGPRGFGEHCLLALDPTAAQAFNVTGNGTVTSNCGVVSNSGHAQAFYVEGNADLTTSAASAVGGIVTNGNGTLTTANRNPGSSPQIDPFGPSGRNIQPPTCPSGYTPLPLPQDVVVQIEAGCHIVPAGGELLFNGNGSFVFAPGVHVFHGDGKVSFNGNITVRGTGVSIVLSGGAWLEMNGNINVDLRAMTTAEAALQPDPARQALAGVLFWQTGTSRQPNFITGNAQTTFNGAIYTPHMPFAMHGNFSMQSTCIQMVARTITITGNADVPNDCDDFPGLDAFETTKIVLAE